MSAIAPGLRRNAGRAGKALRNWQKNMALTEFDLVVECCRLANEPGRADAVRDLAANADWPAFFAIAERHRVTGLAWNGLTSLQVVVPEQTRSDLAARASAIAAQNLQAAVEADRLSTALADASIDHLFVKGLAVGMLAYGSPFLKQSWDIDILVGEASIDRSASLLPELGFDLIFPDFQQDRARLGRWHHVQKDSAWRHRSSGIIVELHSRLADNRLLIPGIGLASPRRQVAITDSIALPTLATDEMFAHLCVHGASSAWFRLKWVSDLAALLRRERADTERLCRRSQELGAGRAAAQALLLVHRLFETALSDELRRELEASAANRWLANAAMAQLLAPEPGSRLFGTATIHATQLMLLPSIRFKIAETGRQLAAAWSNAVD